MGIRKIDRINSERIRNLCTVRKGVNEFISDNVLN